MMVNTLERLVHIKSRPQMYAITKEALLAIVVTYLECEGASADELRELGRIGEPAPNTPDVSWLREDITEEYSNALIEAGLSVFDRTLWSRAVKILKDETQEVELT